MENVANDIHTRISTLPQTQISEEKRTWIIEISLILRLNDSWDQKAKLLKINSMTTALTLNNKIVNNFCRRFHNFPANYIAN